MEHEPDGDLSIELLGVLVSVADRLKAEFVAAAQELGLTPQQAGLLARLREPTPMRVLAEYLHCDASNITGIVDRLEAKDLVGRQPDPRDRRVKRVVLTAEGEAVVARLHRGIDEGEAVLAALTSGQRRQLLQLLRPLVGE
ncbi:MarR family winged helix-turn-helix transcriptional regulator [Streptoalloteichus hindustanus]|uniref:Transcriptional regulator, MarR family n=1 Tax=Streptoalloteichus hindustanus TaxID=2017 RepID=A0A1M4U3R2_STRHI|nr:MarR family transcriptional regulator [Streptoalloteichus hindustanus]SHE51315.1 transcriptional regulator, MarR family [Streptoalloteichus hindustanus]